MSGQNLAPVSRREGILSFTHSDRGKDSLCPHSCPLPPTPGCGNPGPLGNPLSAGGTKGVMDIESPGKSALRALPIQGLPALGAEGIPSLGSGSAFGTEKRACSPHNFFFFCHFYWSPFAELSVKNPMPRPRLRSEEVAPSGQVKCKSQR